VACRIGGHSTVGNHHRAVFLGIVSVNHDLTYNKLMDRCGIHDDVTHPRNVLLTIWDFARNG
jgi:hypothetical protein